jgi:hypothetical protein
LASRQKIIAPTIIPEIPPRQVFGALQSISEIFRRFWEAAVLARKPFFDLFTRRLSVGTSC